MTAAGKRTCYSITCAPLRGVERTGKNLSAGVENFSPQFVRAQAHKTLLHCGGKGRADRFWTSSK